MENLTIVGMKEINQKISKMERSLESIAGSLEKIAKILNRQVPARPEVDRRPGKETTDMLSDIVEPTSWHEGGFPDVVDNG